MEALHVLLQCPRPDWSSCTDIDEANMRFLACCQDENLFSGCHSLCRYGLDKAAVRNTM